MSAPSCSGCTRHATNPTNPQSLIYVGHTGTGFDERELARVMKLLKPLETRQCPFAVRPRTNERPHWVRPDLVAAIKFTEWTADGSLRQPVYLGLRDDKKAADVIREPVSRMTMQTTAHARRTMAVIDRFDPVALVDQLRSIESSRRDGVLQLPGGDRLAVSSLHKVFWPDRKLTKGDLMRYYVRVAPFLLPVVADRPLVMKRFPSGVGGQAFYQQRAPDRVPGGVRATKVRGDADVPSRVIGGSLETLLYLTQLGAISQDPWLSRVSSPEAADFVALDLDPADGVPFARVLDAARWLRDELASLGMTGYPKTSGADGLHIFLPLPPDTPYDAGLIFCQIVATVVSQRHPRVATVERAVSARGRRVYIDYLQNIGGKTLACAYAGVSTPLTWEERDAGVTREDFTIESVPGRLAVVGDLWKGLRESKGIDLGAVSRYAKARGKG